MRDEVESTLAIAHHHDLVRVRRALGVAADAVGLDPVRRTKLLTAASEIARNALTHGGGGEAEVELVEGRGVRLRVWDHGRGIEDVEEALRDGFSTAGSMGVGLGGARRLVDEFALESGKGTGTCVTVVVWKRS